ncbi:hypothetical protein [Agrobacterium pusense]|uniref:hypothetical protein n=3 Tax=Rhizobium/Agrobacterium group TaxID=227290 RepID=UPI000B29CC3D|nr:hypothetical protein [Agrobacterium pusense]MDH0873838.1 hypothetical protein [Agrobacterium pusense]
MADGIARDRVRIFEPSEAVTGFGIVFGVAGAAIALAASFWMSDASGIGARIVYAVIAILAGGSGGIVIGGMIGAIIGVARGRTIRTALHDKQT